MKFNAITWPLYKTVVSVLTPFLFLVGIWSLTFYACYMLREDMQRALSEQQLLQTTEAFAPIESMQQRLVIASLLLTLLVCVLSWFLHKVQRDNKSLGKQLETGADELNKSEQRFQSFVENINDVLFALTPSGLFSYVSPQWTTAFGYESIETIGQQFQSFVHPDDVPYCQTFLQRLMENGDKQSGVAFQVKCKDGHYLWYMANASLLKDPLTETLSLIGIGRDITLLKLTEDAARDMAHEVEAQADELRLTNASLEVRVCKRTAELAKDRQFISRLLQSTDQGIYGTDLDGCCTFINNSGLNTIGYQIEDCLGKNMHDLIHHSHSDGSPYLVEDCPVFRARSAGSGSRINDESFWKSDGSSFPVEYSSYPIIENEEIIGAVITFSDITESKKLKEQLLQSQKMEAVGQLAGGLAHDFNNSLSVINGYCQLIQMEVENNETLNEYLEKIQTASDQAGALTHSMLAFSRTQVMHSQNQNLNGIVSKVGAFVAKIIGDNIKLTVIIKEAKLPVKVDGGQIQQVLINLANNARDAMPDVGDLSITTDKVIMDDSFISLNGFGQEGQYAVITVSDTGTGMDAATKNKIFEPFFTTKAVDKGTGLGLSMVYGIVKQHQGYVDVVSQPGHGARFRVFLPIVEKETTTGDKMTAPRFEETAGTETIMIAEDNADSRLFMDKLFTKLGYHTILAVDGQEAVDKFRENSEKIQLIIMDMIMPNKSGKTAYDEIKQIKPKALALFSSGYSAKIIADQGELGEYAEFITKPIKPAALMKKVREMLDRPLM